MQALPLRPHESERAVLAGETEVNITARRVVKPCSSTPSHLRNFELSLLDQLIPPWLFASIILFYEAGTNSDVSNKLSSLQKSLSETLVLFYPLAGNLKNTTTVECNDAGAAFIEARVNTRLSKFLASPAPDLIDRFMPSNGPKTIEIAPDHLLRLQATVFECGGLALAVCPSHRLLDGSSMCTFLKIWAKAASIGPCPSESFMSPPEFLGSSIVPPNNSLPNPHLKSDLIDEDKFTSRRFVFDGSKIKSLKARCSSVVSSWDKQPTRVEVVQALIVKCAIRAASQLHPGPSVIIQTMNLRNRISPPVSVDAVGNLVGLSSSIIEEGPVELHEVVDLMRRGLKKFQDEKSKRFNPEEGFGVVLEGVKERQELFSRAGPNVYSFSSLCRFPFYEIDFGWSRPVWVTRRPQIRNLSNLVDSRSGDGIEALINMDREVLAMLQHDEEFLAYASIDPSANEVQAELYASAEAYNHCS